MKDILDATVKQIQMSVAPTLAKIMVCAQMASTAIGALALWDSAEKIAKPMLMSVQEFPILV